MDKRVTDEPGTAPDRSAHVLRLPDGRHIGYAEYGARDGIPVLALHGTPGARTMFALMDDAARAKGIRIIAPDRPGYGLSDAHHIETLAETAHDIEALADGLGLDQFALVGYSGGGPHALAAALHLKKRISRLALISTVGLVADGEPVSMSGLHHFIFSYLGRSQFAASAYFLGVQSMIFWVPGGAEHFLTQYATDSDHAVLRRPEVRRTLETSMHEGFSGSIQGAVQDLRLYCQPWDLPLHELETPVVMWQGSADTIVPPEAAYRLADALPDCRLEVAEDMGHYWLFGAVEAVLDSIHAGPRSKTASRIGLRTWF